MMFQETVVGKIERVTYYNPETGYAVVRVTTERSYTHAEGRDGTVTVVGTILDPGVGQQFEFVGQWVDDDKYGRQFRVESAVPIMPASEEGIINYLSSGIVHGIGPKTARKIVEHFGTKTLDVLNNAPERLDEVRGLKRELAEALKREWHNNAATRQAMIFLQGYGVSTRMAKRIFEHYGAVTVQSVRSDPFALADEVHGIGFIKADTIARNMGIAPDAENRIRAGLHYALNQLANDGHTYAPRKKLIETAAQLLKVENTDRIQAVLSSELLHRNLIADPTVIESEEEANSADEAIYLPLYFHSERGAANRLKVLARERSPLSEEARQLDWTRFLGELTRTVGVELSPQQQGAVRAALENKVSVLTGGPGTGKTTTLKMVIQALDKLKMTYALCSPTGRAAKRLSEATGQPARTIHRMLEYKPGEGFTRNEENPLEVDMLIVDETSMVDLLLLNDLLKALKPETHLMLVGDVDQLPSVGAGNVLRDVIESGAAHVTRLNVIFRQPQDSHIIINAHRINQGEMPYLENKSSDFYFFAADDPEEAGDLVVDIVVNRLPKKFGFDPKNEVQVIAPMYRGPVGVNVLNERLQKALNGERRVAEKLIGGRLFRLGDKVMQTRNNYEKDVFNGDIGVITGFDFDDGALEVVIDGQYIYYDWNEAEELIHAYCISTHRSQGSEYPVIVMPVMTQHYIMLQRNLLYTAVTRAKRMVVLVGSRKAVYLAVNNNKVSERFSGLRRRLKTV